MIEWVHFRNFRLLRDATLPLGPWGGSRCWSAPTGAARARRRRDCGPCFEDTREPVQVVATMHSPAFLTHSFDHPHAIVLAQRAGGQARFEKQADRPDLDDLLRDAPTGERWFPPSLQGVTEEG